MENIKQILKAIQRAFTSGNVMWRTHAQERMSERDISREDVKVVIQNGEILESYELDKPFPSFLIYGKSDDRVMHAVVAWDNTGQIAYVITAYEPDKKHFQTDLKSRQRN